MAKSVLRTCLVKPSLRSAGIKWKQKHIAIIAKNSSFICLKWRAFANECLIQYAQKSLIIYDKILIHPFCGAWTCKCQPSRLSSVYFFPHDICVKVNKMPEGPVFKAATNGDVEASVSARLSHSAFTPTSASLAWLRKSHYMLPYPPHRPAHSPHTHAYYCSQTPQEVRRLLASGLKPDSERDYVSVLWCRLE